MTDTFYYAILSRPLKTQTDAMMYEVRMIVDNNIPRDRLARLTMKKYRRIGRHYRILRRVYPHEIRKPIYDTGRKQIVYVHDTEWEKSLLQQHKRVMQWLKSRKARII
jgi:hypothetical protein